MIDILDHLVKVIKELNKVIQKGVNTDQWQWKQCKKIEDKLKDIEEGMEQLKLDFEKSFKNLK